MTVGILVVTHGQIGEQIIKTTCETLGNCPLPIHSISVPHNNHDLESVGHRAQAAFEALDQGDGVLVLTDLFGSTPSNIASKLLPGHHALMISGLNLPMLIRIMNYSDLALEELADKAVSAAKDGAILSPATHLM